MDPSQMTPEQLKVIAEYLRSHNPASPAGYAGAKVGPQADIGGLEDRGQMQQQMGAGLMGGGAPSMARNDVGSNIGRAGFGLASAMRNYQAGKAEQAASEARKITAAEEKARLAKRAAFQGGGDSLQELGGENY